MWHNITFNLGPGHLKPGGWVQVHFLLVCKINSSPPSLFEKEIVTPPVYEDKIYDPPPTPYHNHSTPTPDMFYSYFQKKYCCILCTCLITNLQFTKITSSPKGNDHSPETSVPRSNLILKKHINGPWKPEARNRTRPSFYACPGYQQL